MAVNTSGHRSQSSRGWDPGACMRVAVWHPWGDLAAECPRVNRTRLAPLVTIGGGKREPRGIDEATALVQGGATVAIEWWGLERFILKIEPIWFAEGSGSEQWEQKGKWKRQGLQPEQLQDEVEMRQACQASLSPKCFQGHLHKWRPQKGQLGSHVKVPASEQWVFLPNLKLISFYFK